ncbi:MAG: tetraacyldisaccharide 4'-kinase [Syntrophales bacterium]
MIRLRNTWRDIWDDNGSACGFNPLILFLISLSLLYRKTIKLRNHFYDIGVCKQKKLSGKVISVGNITVGGTGKTTMVIMLAKMLKEQGYHPAVLSRGYGGKRKKPVNIVSDGTRLLMGHVEAGDEPVLMAKAADGIPVLTGPKRILTGRLAMELMEANVLILDDGFQHRSLFRDIDIVLMDIGRPFGNGCLLPRGPLREPPEALKRADIIVWTGTYNGREDDFSSGDTSTRSLPPPWPGCDLSHVFRGCHGPKQLIQGGTGKAYSLEHLKGKRVCAFAGIGSPESFRGTVESLGGRVVTFIPFPDHYRYNRKDIAVIQKAFNASAADIIVTTEKDGVKLEDFPCGFLQEIFFLSVEMEIASGDTFKRLILDKLKQEKNPFSPSKEKC